MKAKAILTAHPMPESTEDDCEHCAVHSHAYRVLPQHECAHCSADLGDVPEVDAAAVGQFNFFDENEEIVRADVYRCAGCDQHTALMPVKVGYNGNHDTYYTGGPKYLMDEDIKELLSRCQKKAQEQLTQWETRRAAGENLAPWNLATWLNYTVSEELAKLLYEKGLKR